MSEAHAEKFLDQVKGDPSLQQELQNPSAGFLAAAREQGLEFTQEELHSVLKKRWGVQQQHDDPNTTCAGGVPTSYASNPSE